MYRNVQFGTLIVLILLFGIGLCIWLGMQTSLDLIKIIIAGVLIVLLALFYNLTVEVKPPVIRCCFGIGLISRTIPIDQVQGTHHVRNRWYYGWGIRRVSGAWIFNVSGFDAVELTLSTGKIFRIGTNDPTGLILAINRAKNVAS